jgi:hypothetical protein
MTLALLQNRVAVRNPKRRCRATVPSLQEVASRAPNRGTGPTLVIALEEVLLTRFQDASQPGQGIALIGCLRQKSDGSTGCAAPASPKPGGRRRTTRIEVEFSSRATRISSRSDFRLARSIPITGVLTSTLLGSCRNVNPRGQHEAQGTSLRKRTAPREQGSQPRLRSVQAKSFLLSLMMEDTSDNGP